MRVDMVGHPFNDKPEIAVDIIKLKSECTSCERQIREATENNPEDPHWTLFSKLYAIKCDMINLLKKYEKEVKWCPYCNEHKETWDEKLKEDPFPKSDKFGSILTHVKIFNSYEGWECKVCGRSDVEKIEHWN